MDIAALSMGLSQMKVSQQAGISVMKMAMDSPGQSTADLIQAMEVSTKTMEQSVAPYLGGNLDISL